MKTRFILYGFMGWCLEVFWTGLGSLIRGDATLHGWTYIWMFPIYGLAILLEPVHERIRDWPVAVRGGIYTVLIFAIEYVTGTALRMILGVCPWDYSASPYSIHGVIRLDFAPFWFIVGLLFEKVHDALVGMNILKKAS